MNVHTNDFIKLLAVIQDQSVDLSIRCLIGETMRLYMRVK